jgi:hypothetical protein
VIVLGAASPSAKLTVVVTPTYSGRTARLVARLVLARRLSAMDPAAPALRAWERYARSVALLNLVRDDAAACQAAADVAAESRPVSAQRGGADPRPAADTNLDRAARLWKVTSSRCPAGVGRETDELFSRLLAPAS